MIVVRPKDTESKLTVKSYTPGDVNSDGAVSVTDVGCAINYILEQVPSVFIFEAADMNGDKSVSVTDVGMIINCILSDGAASRRMGQSVQSTAEASNALKVQSLKVTPGGSVELSIELENASTNLMGWQCDIVLPEGLTLALKDNGKPAAKLGDRFSTTGHAISSSRLANGAYRFIATSMDGEAIPCNGGTLFTVTLQADAALTAGTRLTGTVANIEFNTQDNQKLTLNDVAVAVDITGGTTTGVASVRAVLVQSRDGQVIVSGIDDDTMVAVYDLAGRQVGHAVGSGGTATVSTTLRDGDKAIVKVGQRTVKLIVKP